MQRQHRPSTLVTSLSTDSQLTQDARQYLADLAAVWREVRDEMALISAEVREINGIASEIGKLAGDLGQLAGGRYISVAAARQALGAMDKLHRRELSTRLAKADRAKVQRAMALWLAALERTKEAWQHKECGAFFSVLVHLATAALAQALWQPVYAPPVDLPRIVQAPVVPPPAPDEGEGEKPPSTPTFGWGPS